MLFAFVLMSPDHKVSARSPATAGGIRYAGPTSIPTGPGPTGNPLGSGRAPTASPADSARSSRRAG
jgi:hypothetical protein